MRPAAACIVLFAACEQPPAPSTALADRADQPAIALAPPSVAPRVTGSALTFVERRGDNVRRHGDITAVGISPTGRFAATGGADGGVAVWDTRDGQAVAWIQTPHDRIESVAPSDDGSRLATAGSDGYTRAWDLARGTQLWQMHERSDRLRFTADGTRLVAGHLAEQVLNSEDGRVIFPAPREIIEPGIADLSAIATAASVGVTVVATGVSEYHTRCEQGVTASGATVATRHLGIDVGLGNFSLADGGAYDVAVSPRGDRVAIVGHNDLELFTTAGTLLAHVPVRVGYSDPRVLLTETPRYAITHDHGSVAGWDVLAGHMLWHEQRPVPAYDAPQLAPGDTLVFTSKGACVALRISDGRELWRREGCLHIAAALTSRLVAIAAGPSMLDVVDATTGKSVFPAHGSTGPVGALTSLAVSRDGQHVAGVARDRSLWLWDASSARQLANPPEQLWTPILRFLANGRLAVVNEGPLLATGFLDDGHEGTDVFLHRYDVDRDRIEASRSLRLRDRIDGVGVFAEETVIVEEMHDDDYARIQFDLHDRSKPRRLPLWKRPRVPYLGLRGDSLNTAVVDAAGNRTYVTSQDNHVNAWDTRTGRLIARDAEDNGFTKDLVLTSDRKHVIVPRYEGPTVVLDAATLRQVRKLTGPRAHVAMAAVSPDDALVVTAAYDGLFVWRLADGASVGTVDFSASRESPSSLAFSPDGKTLWVGTSTGNLLQFRVAP